jgi:hypothetical protein
MNRTPKQRVRAVWPHAYCWRATPGAPWTVYAHGTGAAGIALARGRTAAEAWRATVKLLPAGA